MIITNIARFYGEPVCLQPIGKSDHNCIILKIKSRVVRSFKDSGIKSFGTWIQNQDWTDILNSTGTQEKTDAFYRLLNKAVDSHFPKVIKRLCVSDKPWMTPKIKKLISVRQAAFAVGDSNKWRTLRNKVKREIVTAKTIMMKKLDINRLKS